jgi:hypothetical protein
MLWCSTLCSACFASLPVVGKARGPAHRSHTAPGVVTSLCSPEVAALESLPGQLLGLGCASPPHEKVLSGSPGSGLEPLVQESCLHVNVRELAQVGLCP